MPNRTLAADPRANAEAGRPMAWAPPLVVATVLCSLMVFQSLWFGYSKGITVDETYYLNAGSRMFRLHDVSMAADNPPLSLLATQWPAAVWSDRAAAAVDNLGRQLGPGDLRLIRMARLAHVLIFGVPLVLIVMAWLTRRRGLLIGAVGGGLVACSPGLVAHSGLSTTDSPASVLTLVCLIALAAYRDKPSTRRYVALAVAMGLAMATKYSSLLLFPVVGVFMLEMGWRQNASSEKRLLASLDHAIRRTLWVFFLAIAVCSVAYLFKPVYVIRGITSVFIHNDAGHPAFLCGAISDDGWWYYFPAAFLFKSTAAELLLAVLALLLLPRFARNRQGANCRDSASVAWLLCGCVFGAIAMTASINIGVRHILVLYPLLILWTMDQLGSLLPGRRALVVSVCLVLVGLQAHSAYRIAPHYLAYFNPIAGGPNGGYRYLVDSNLDWGQDLPLLSRELNRLPFERVLLCYFGTDRPEYHGINCRRLPDAAEMVPSQYDAVAISATALCGPYDDTFLPFLDVQPSARAGYSILIYDLKSPPAATALREVVDGLEEDAPARMRIPLWAVTK